MPWFHPRHYEVFIFSYKVIFNPYPKTSLPLELELGGSKVREAQREHTEGQKESVHPAALNQPTSGYAEGSGASGLEEFVFCKSFSIPAQIKSFFVLNCQVLIKPGDSC